MRDDSLYTLVLGSKSPRRKELLGWLKIPFEIEVAECDEVSNFEDPKKVAEDIAKQKGLAVLEAVQNKYLNPLVIASDTIVVIGDSILGKPTSIDDAICTLRKLSGKVHTVISGVYIGFKDIFTGEYKEKVFHSSTEVIFNNISEDLLKIYLDSGEAMDKAGAYGIQGQALTFIKSVSGSYSNVVGFPLSTFIDELKYILGKKDDTIGQWRKLMRHS